MQYSLLSGEEIDFKPSVELQQKSTEESINKKYATGEVRIVTEQARYQLTSIPAMIEGDDYELNPEFQRRHRWSVEQKSRLVESFIMNVPVPPIFLYEDEYSHYEVMDGLQRLTAIYEFYSSKFELVGLEEWPELNGYKYSNLPDKIKRGVDRRYLSSIILLQETAKSEEEAIRLKQLVFERINSGGEKLGPQETRNAIYNGPLNQLCIKLARHSSLCATWDIPLPTAAEETGSTPEELIKNTYYAEMSDVELVLRFFAWRQRSARKLLNKQSQRSLSDFLDIYLKLGNEYNQSTLKSLEDLFINTIDLIHECFGDSAFYMYRRRAGKDGKEYWNWRHSPTTTIYDSLMLVFSMRLYDADKIRENKENIKSGIEDFYRKNYEHFSGRNVNSTNLDTREDLFDSYISDCIK